MPIVGGPIPMLVVHCCIRKQAERTMWKNPISSKPPWPLNQLLNPCNCPIWVLVQAFFNVVVFWMKMALISSQGVALLKSEPCSGSHFLQIVCPWEWLWGFKCSSQVQCYYLFLQRANNHVELSYFIITISVCAQPCFICVYLFLFFIFCSPPTMLLTMAMIMDWSSEL